MSVSVSVGAGQSDCALVFTPAPWWAEAYSGREPLSGGHVVGSQQHVAKD